VFFSLGVQAPGVYVEPVYVQPRPVYIDPRFEYRSEDWRRNGWRHVKARQEPGFHSTQLNPVTGTAAP
jgi:hypothetical protein